MFRDITELRTIFLENIELHNNYNTMLSDNGTNKLQAQIRFKL